MGERGDGLKNLALLDLNSVFTDIVDRGRRRSNVDAQYVDFTRTSMTVLAIAVNRDDRG